MSQSREIAKEFTSNIPPPTIKTNSSSSNILKPRLSLQNEVNQLKPAKFPSKMLPPGSLASVKSSSLAKKARPFTASSNPRMPKSAHPISSRSVSASSHFGRPASAVSSSLNSSDDVRSMSDESMESYNDEKSVNASALRTTEDRLRSMEMAYAQLSAKVIPSPSKRPANYKFYEQRIAMLEESLEVERSRTSELQEQFSVALREKAEAEANKIVSQKGMESLEIMLNSMKSENHQRMAMLEENHARVMETAELQHQAELQDFASNIEQKANSLIMEYKNELQSAEEHFSHKIKELTSENELKISRLQEEKDSLLKKVQEGASLAMQRVQNKHDLEKKRLQSAIQPLQEENNSLKQQIEQLQRELASETVVKENLKSSLDQQSANVQKLESTNRALESTIKTLEEDVYTMKNKIIELEGILKSANVERDGLVEKLIAEETLRRKLHNTIQELKGNIRVFCRVRPPLGDGESAQIAFPDQNSEASTIEIVAQAPGSSLTGNGIKQYAFNFDRVFSPETTNEDVFNELSQLIQSAMDGYNVCIFAYGQTGSGKTHTMSSNTGMIPSSVRMIYNRSTSLKERGWEYRMEGQFLEIYNETIIDLLASGNEEEKGKKKLEIYHDTKAGRTTITNITSEPLDTPEQVTWLLDQASKNRSVAATNANEHSSRSHSVFMLHLNGSNSTTGETCRSTLNLIDLAGSERLSSSQSVGERLKETQAINKSLSCLGDVIHALGSGKEGTYIPYRNSKLTNLLQYSLGGNSKTLMFVNISPLKQHVPETLCSLRFATKVNNTQIGTARKVTK